MAQRLYTTLLGRLPAALPRQLVSGSCQAGAMAAAARRSQHWHRQQLRQLAGGRAAAEAGGEQEPCSSGQPEDSHLFQSILSGILAPYWESTPTAEAVIGSLEQQYPDACIGFDHFAFRTFGVDGLGIASAAQLSTDFGYQRRDVFEFPAKKLRAYWYSPPDPELPRIFISELKVEELSQQAQEVIHKYAGGTDAALLGKYGVMSSLLGVQPWCTPTWHDFQTLAAESEYAAWVLVNGYALNHTTIAVHRLVGHTGGIDALNGLLQGQGFLFNTEGGLTKVSPDGLLLQSSTVADRVSYCFAGGETRLVPGAYVEFAERRVLPQYEHLKPEEVGEQHRRDGFETASADRIFESTTLAAEQLQ